MNPKESKHHPVGGAPDIGGRAREGGVGYYLFSGGNQRRFWKRNVSKKPGTWGEKGTLRGGGKRKSGGKGEEVRTTEIKPQEGYGR